MLTRVILDGAMGKQFGRTWDLAINSPAEALRIIDANKPGLFIWIRNQLSKVDRYIVVCEYADGRREEMDDKSIFMHGKPTRIRFVPLIAGAGAGVRFVLGAVLVAVAFIPGMQAASPYLLSAGAALMLGAVIELLIGRPKNDQEERKDKTSHYFDGPVNTTAQGVPVPLIYGRVLVGSHHISAAMSIDQIIDPDYVAPPEPPPVVDPLEYSYGEDAPYYHNSSGD